MLVFDTIQSVTPDDARVTDVDKDMGVVWRYEDSDRVVVYVPTPWYKCVVSVVVAVLPSP